MFAKKTYLGFEFKQGIESFLSRVSTSLGIRKLSVHWGADETVAIDLRWGQVILPNVPVDQQIPGALVKRYAGFVLHELLHAMWTDPIHPPDQYLNQLRNALEDARIENKAINSGLTGNARELFKSLAQSLVDKAQGVDWSDPSTYPFSLAIFCRGYGIKIPVNSALLPIWKEAKRRVQSAQSNHDSLKIAEWVLAQIKQNQDQDQNQSESTEGDDQGQEGGEQGGDGAEPFEGPVGAPEGDAMETEPNVEVPGAGAGLPHTETGQVWMLHTPQPIAPYPAALAFNLKRLFERTDVDEWQGQKTQGSFDPRRAFALHTGEVFRTRFERDGIDSACVIVVDCSGSMSMCDRIKHARDAVAGIAQALDRAKVAQALVIFDESVHIAAGFNVPIKQRLNIIGRLTDLGTTNDQGALAVATDLLLSVRADRRVILFLTDGVSPTVSITQERVKSAEALGIKVIGIGIQEDVSQLFPRNATVNNVSDLGKVAFTQLARAA
jgi:hypothetical protein